MKHFNLVLATATGIIGAMSGLASAQPVDSPQNGNANTPVMMTEPAVRSPRTPESSEQVRKIVEDDTGKGVGLCTFPIGKQECDVPALSAKAIEKLKEIGAEYLQPYDICQLSIGQQLNNCKAGNAEKASYSAIRLLVTAWKSIQSHQLGVPVKLIELMALS
ncbi:hypothetical protein HRG_014307 [Hirsutella rhossiliensis]